MLHNFRNYINYTYAKKKIVPYVNDKDNRNYLQNEQNIISSRQWFNIVYAFNKNNVKLLPIKDNMILRLLKSYFFLYNLKFDKKTKLSNAKISKKNKIISVKKPFFSKVTLKHTNTKVIITLYIFNPENMFIQKKLRNIKKIYKSKILRSFLHKNLYKLKSFSKKNVINKLYFENKRDINIKNYNNIKRNLLIKTLKKNWTDKIKLIRSKGKSLIKTLTKNSIKSKLFSQKYNNILGINTLRSFYVKNNNSIIYKKYKKFLKKALQKELLFIYRKRILDLYKLKFQDIFLLHLNKIIYKIYKKKVEFNFVNLKYHYLNSDIFIQMIASKFKRNKKISMWRMLRKSVGSLKLNSTLYNIDLNKDIGKKNTRLNKSKNIYLYHLFKNNNLKKDMLDNILNKIFNYENTNDLTKNFEVKKVINYIKHKRVIGLKFEAGGRLSRRFTASRSLSKRIIRGTLKNIESYNKNTFSLMLRGNLNYNLDYSKFNSKLRTGSFGLKGWLNTK